ncbi:zinc ribbon domain-containing protein [Demequina pelophila]|uniref:zinc ribbon domain-containing protein n=1 Tax=Demequina pelophila TaxID=1638984 RepID=UPI000785BB7F|nr:C4-type zinc ribbon domain-containing protein [Demequina pelophila]
MPTAPAADQRRLLDVQDLDLRAQQARHRRTHMPVLAQIEELTARLADLDEERVARATEVSDLRRAVTKAEDDVENVRTRAARDTARLESGQGSAKDLQALQAELEVLTRRQGDLETIELEAMEALDGAEAALASAQSQVDAIRAQVDQLSAERDAAWAQIDRELEDITGERAGAIDGLDAALVTLYERLRDQNGGVGAAALQGNQCLGCHMPLNPGDLAAIQSRPADDVVRCEECGRILVREAKA